MERGSNSDCMEANINTGLSIRVNISQKARENTSLIIKPLVS